MFRLFLRRPNKKAPPSKKMEGLGIFDYFAFVPVFGLMVIVGGSSELDFVPVFGAVVIGGVLEFGNSLFDSILNLSTGGVSYE